MPLLEEEEEAGKLKTRSDLAELVEVWPRRLWIAWWMPFREASGRDLVEEGEEDVGEDDRRQSC